MLAALFAVTATVSAAVPIELGLGATGSAGVVAGDSSTLLGGGGLGLTFRAGDRAYGMATLDATLPFAQLSTRVPSGNVADVYFNPLAAASVGAGFRFLDDDHITAGIGGSAFYAVLPYTCGDCFNIRGGIGVAPHVFVGWRVTRWLELEGRALLTVDPIQLVVEHQPYAALFMTLSATFRYDVGDPWN